MRLELSFELARSEFHIDYRRIIISYLKDILSKCNDGSFFEKYFKDNHLKDYCFSVVFYRPEYSGTKILLKGNQIKIIFSSSDRSGTGLIFFSAFILQKHKMFKLPDGNHMILKKIEQKKEQLITSNKVIFRTMPGAGLCCRLHQREGNKDYHYTFADPEFEEQMKQILKLQALNAGFTQVIADNIYMKPIQWKKAVVIHYDTMIDVNVGMFEMQADPELLQYFYQAGVASRSAAGFGQVDLVTQDLL